MDTQTENLLVIFDDHCVLCSRAFGYILRNDRHERFRFATISMLPNRIRTELNADSTVILIQNDKVFSESGAFIRIMLKLGGIRRISALLYLIPPFIRNYFYRFIARNRFRWWGKSNSCILPGNSVSRRFLNQEELSKVLVKISIQ